MTSDSSRAKNVLAITWEDHRRMRELCDWLGVELHVLRSKHRGARRYMELALQTFSTLLSHRPPAVFLQNPSLILALVALFTRPLAGGYRVVMDAHNEAVVPYSYAFWPITWLTRLAQRLADVTIVTNGALAETVRSNGGRPLVLPDRLPTPPVAPGRRGTEGPFEVMVVATYAADEPIAEIFAAARALGGGFSFAVTGNSRKLAPELRDALPANVRLTGFLPEHGYWELMASCHAVLDLTLKDNCLVCGAYEALALSKPMILSGNQASRDLFGDFAVFPENSTPSAIAEALDRIRSGYGDVLQRTDRGRPVFAERWLQAAESLRRALLNPAETDRRTR